MKTYNIKKTAFVATFAVLSLITTLNIWQFITPQSAFADLFLNKAEAIAASECSVYDYDDQILGEITYYCNKDKDWCQRKGCKDMEGKCCDSRLITTEH